MWERQTFPNLFVVLVGPPAARKGTAMAPASMMLRQTGIHMAAESLTLASLIKVLKRSYSGVDTSDTGIVKPHSSLTVFNEELTVLIGYQDKALVDNLCNMFDCPDPWRKETTTQGVFEIPAVYLNILGATTPDNLVQSLPVNVVGGGFFSRAVIVYTDKRAKAVELPFMKRNETGGWDRCSVITDPDDELHKTLFHDLQYVKMLSGQFLIHEDWISRWIQWYPSQDIKHFHGTPLEFYIGRRQLQVLKLSIISCASRREGNKLLIEYDFDRALGWLEETEPHMLEAFAGFGKSDDAQAMYKVGSLIGLRKQITLSELLNTYWRDIGREQMLRVIGTLESMQQCQYDAGKGIVISTMTKEQA
jgi:hypothetical protein